MHTWDLGDQTVTHYNSMTVKQHWLWSEILNVFTMKFEPTINTGRN